MVFGNIFRSKKEIEQIKKRERRAMEREVENAIERSRERIADFEKERKKTWEKARELMISGQRTEAARLVQTYQMLGLQISKLEKQNAYAQSQLSRIACAEDMKIIAAAMKDFAEAADINPDEVADDIDVVAGVSADIKDIDHRMAQAAEKEQEQMLADIATDKANAVENNELMAVLEREAAATVREKAGADAIKTADGDTATANDAKAEDAN